MVLHTSARAQSASFSSPDGKAAPTELYLFLNQRDQVVKEAMEVLKSKDSNRDLGGPLDMAVSVLGRLRVKEAVPFLCQNITFIPIRTHVQVPGRPEIRDFLSIPETPFYYTCAAALLCIGECRELDTVLPRVIMMTTDHTQSDLSCWVLLRVKGRDKAINFLKKEHKGRMHEDKRKIDRAIKFIRDYHPTFGPPAPNSIFGLSSLRSSRRIEPGERIYLGEEHK